MANGDGKYGPSWKWIVGILAGVLIAVSGTLYTDMRANIAKLQEGKVDKEQYRCDVTEIKQGIRDINEWFIKRGKSDLGAILRVFLPLLAFMAVLAVLMVWG
jgi:hypothetical protein